MANAARTKVEPRSNGDLFALLGISEYSEKTQVYADLSYILSNLEKDKTFKNKVSSALLNLSLPGSSYENLSKGDKKSLTDSYKIKNPSNQNPGDEDLENFANDELSRSNEEVLKFRKDRAEHQKKVYSAVGEVLKEIDGPLNSRSSSPSPSSRSSSPGTSPKPSHCETLRSKLVEKGALDENQGR